MLKKFDKVIVLILDQLLYFVHFQIDLVENFVLNEMKFDFLVVVNLLNF